jgi:hypothetical protein
MKNVKIGYVAVIREGTAGYHFVFESFWQIRMIPENNFLSKYNLL